MFLAKAENPPHGHFWLILVQKDHGVRVTVSKNRVRFSEKTLPMRTPEPLPIGGSGAARRRALSRFKFGRSGAARRRVLSGFNLKLNLETRPEVSEADFQIN